MKLHKLMTKYFFSDLYDLSYQPNSFGTYMANVYLTLIGNNYSESAEIVLNATKNLLNPFETSMELPSVSKLLLADDYKKMNSNQLKNGISGWAQSCFDSILEESFSRNDPFFKDYEGAQNTAVCNNLTMYSECEDYCNWHKNITKYEHFSRSTFFSLMR